MIKMTIKILLLINYNDLSFITSHIQMYVTFQMPHTNHLPVCT